MLNCGDAPDIALYNPPASRSRSEFRGQRAHRSGGSAPMQFRVFSGVCRIGRGLSVRVSRTVGTAVETRKSAFFSVVSCATPSLPFLPYAARKVLYRKIITRVRAR